MTNGVDPTAGLYETTINERWRLYLPQHRADRQEWPVWEKERLDATWRCLTDDGRRSAAGDVVYDIGAEEGDFPALWASWGADVVLVEPNPKVWPNIRTIFEGNGLVDRLRGWHVGFAGDEIRPGAWDHYQPGEALDSPVARPDDPIFESTLSATQSPIVGWPRCSYGPVIGDHGFLVLPERPDVPVTTIDRLAMEVGAPSVITIDVEGAELTVLRGAQGVLAVDRPAVFVSVHLDLPWIDEKYPGDTEERVFAWMDQFGYEGKVLAVDHEKHVEFRHPEGR